MLTLLSDDVLLMRPNRLPTKPSIMAAALLCGAASMPFTLHTWHVYVSAGSHQRCRHGIQVSLQQRLKCLMRS